MPEFCTHLPVFKPVEGHFHPAPFYLTQEMYEGLPVEIAGGPIDHLVGRPVAELHTHECDEIYLLISPSPAGARIEVTVGHEIIEVSSPATVRIPGGTLHRFLTLEAEPGSYCLGVLLTSSSEGQ